ncbi:endo-1,4-beta-xylanase [Halanaerobium saccharolyticum]|uniref:Beta-xylanase n=1 Tax=Halanaerobium saccharolyticum TaxID=43595 RepID=A0A4R7YXD0_9FIRM|nr:endo-1,4-beta-xylanase [Halanaerobium saccharolyticum]RAK07180.1 endo-1,4-beta-xylanase [Halanaerobium saccharolyticum]TDW02093.1 endo-1,4-beta-xylanase [Halanaerobium saccharolyticum]TDX58824.1 endo-1,4-beta-xylanase [Halanaerobium saccharolyticum]
MNLFSKNNLQSFGILIIIIISISIFSSAATAVKIYEFDFESGSGNWAPRGDGVELEVVEREAASGSQSLFVSGRKQNWHGPSLDLQSFVEANEEYLFSLKVKLAEGSEPAEITISTENNKDGDNSWDNIATVEASAAEWVEISSEYTVKPDMDRITLYAESPAAELEFYIDDLKIEKEGEIVQEIETDIPSLAETYKDYFKIGAAIEPYQLEGEHAKILKKHFNSLTAENVMKPETIQSEKGQFDFTAADKIREFTKENKMVMRGHTLVWHSQIPDWFFEGPKGELVPKEVLLDRMRTHIEVTMKHFKGDIDSWDVVNEAIDPASEETDGLRNSKWYQIAGIDYIKEAFIHANRIDPEAKLYINDYSLLSDPAKRDIMYKLVQDLLAEGIPVDGIGMQGHVNIESPSISTMERSIEKFASLGVDLQITELDMSVYTNNSQSFDTFSEELAVKQGHRYREIFNLFKQYSDQITNVALWGIGDDYTWLTGFPVERNNWPLLFDRELKAKLAFWGVVDPDRLPVITKKFDVSQGSPEIDAKNDEIWANTGNTLNLEENEFLGGDLKLSWDENNIYLYGQISDQSVNPEDSIEIFVDEYNAKEEAVQEDIKHYQIRRNGSSELEAAVPFVEITAEEGQIIGFDFQVNDDANGDGSRDGVTIWNDQSGEGWRNMSGLGNLIFVK